MRFTTLFGLPAHPLLVHLPIVLLPLVGLAGLAMAFSSRTRARIGWITVALSFVGFIGIHLATESGEALEDSVKRTAALRAHTSLADTMQPLALVLFLVLLGSMVLHQWSRRSTVEITPEGVTTTPSRRAPGWLTPLVGVAVVIASIGVNVQLIRVGHNGAKASWQNVKVTNR